MADYFIQFSAALALGSAEAATRALALLATLRHTEEDALCGFEVGIDTGDPGTLFLTDGDGQGDPEHVIAFVLTCAEAFALTGRWGFSWALTCSKARGDGFGGGAQLLDLGTRRSLAWIDCAHWLELELAPDSNAPLAPPP